MVWNLICRKDDWQLLISWQNAQLCKWKTECLQISSIRSGRDCLSFAGYFALQLKTVSRVTSRHFVTTLSALHHFDGEGCTLCIMLDTLISHGVISSNMSIEHGHGWSGYYISDLDSIFDLIRDRCLQNYACWLWCSCIFRICRIEACISARYHSCWGSEESMNQQIE